MNDDDRVTCRTCKNHVQGWCRDAISAKLSRKQRSIEIAPAFAELQQRCPAYIPMAIKLQRKPVAENG